jgi:microcystin-dependent protein
MPAHTHLMRLKAAAATSPGQTPGPAVTPAQAFAGPTTAPVAVNIYGTATNPDLTMSPAAIGTTGASQPHENRQPFLTLNICIALQGIYPSRQ